MRQALMAKTPSIGLYSQQDEEKVKYCITNLFLGTSKYFNNPLSIDGANIIADELLSNYESRQLRLEDLFVICKEIKESDTIVLTPARILKFVNNYVQRREKTAIQLSQELSENAKALSGENDIDTRIKNSIRHIQKSNEIVVKQRLKAIKFK